MSLAMLRRGSVASSRVSYVFPQNTAVLDDFNRANEGPPPSANWTTISGTGFQVNTSQLEGVASEQYMRWNPSTFAANQEAWIQIPTKGGNGVYTGVLLRYSTVADSGYQLYHVVAAGTDTWEIYKYTAGVAVQLGTTTTGPELAAGDYFGGNAVGNALTIWTGSSVVGMTTQVMTLTDSTYTGTGAIGVYGNGTVERLDNFGGGSIV